MLRCNNMILDGPRTEQGSAATKPYYVATEQRLAATAKYSMATQHFVLPPNRRK